MFVYAFEDLSFENCIAHLLFVFFKLHISWKHRYSSYILVHSLLVVYRCKSIILCGNLVQEFVHIASIISGGVSIMGEFNHNACIFLCLLVVSLIVVALCLGISLSDVLLLFLSVYLQQI